MSREPRLGLAENAAQFALLVLLTAFIGAMAGLERSVLPLVGEEEFGVTSSAALLAFLAAFGAAKALTNLGAGTLSDRVGRSRLLTIGWLVALPVAPMVALAPNWGWIVAANLLLGVNQGLAWSMAVIMKIDLVGPARRGLALGLNEAGGYVGVAAAALATGLLASTFAPRTTVWVGALMVALVGLALSVALVRDTAPYVRREQRDVRVPLDGPARPFREWTLNHPILRACSQAGLVNNANDALVWGLVPVFLLASGLSTGEIALVAALYPAVWGLGQIVVGWAADYVSHQRLIVLGMLLQAGALAVLASRPGELGWALSAATGLGVGTALVYPTLMAAVSAAVEPIMRAPAIGVYRFWRDAGIVAGAIIAGVTADVFEIEAAIWVLAALTALSGLAVAATRWAAPS